MRGYTPKIYLSLKHILLLAVYIAFFLVQFLGSNSFSQNFSNAAIASFKPVAPLHSKDTKFTSCKTKDSKKLAFRLNKRYHPESFDYTGYTPMEPALIILNIKQTSKPKDYLLISSILRDSLRGPPVVS